MKLLISIALLILGLPLYSESSSQESVQAIAEAHQVAPLNSPASQDTSDQEAEPDQPKHIGKVPKHAHRRERSKHVLDLVLAGIVVVGTFVAIILL